MVKNKQLVVADEKTMAVKKPANKKAVVSNKRTTMEWVNGQLNVLQEEQQAVFSADGAVMKQKKRVAAYVKTGNVTMSTSHKVEVTERLNKQELVDRMFRPVTLALPSN